MIEQRILVVDDDDAIRALLFTVLRRRGFRVDAARNGFEAMERCARCHYAVVLLDLMMPRKSGYDVLAEFAAFDAAERPVVIVLTAGNQPRDLDPGIVAGTMRKPFDISLLVDTVAACLATAPSREQRNDCPAPETEPCPGERNPN